MLDGLPIGFQQFSGKSLLAFEVAVKRALRHVGSPDDILHAARVEAHFVDNPAACVEQTAADFGVDGSRHSKFLLNESVRAMIDDWSVIVKHNSLAPRDRAS